MLTWFLKLKDLKKPITLMQFNFILAIWLGLVLNFGFLKKLINLLL
jgi:lipid A ethanolaminephosphotransferase